MEWESDSPCLSHTCGGQEHDSPTRGSRGLLEFRDYGAIPVRGLLLIAKRQFEGIWERRSLWEMPVEESRAATEARRYCWVTHIAPSIASLSPHTSIGSWTIEKLAHQTHDSLNHRAGPHPECSFKWLMHRSTESTPVRRAPVCA